jgi:outer membrane protein OmpA-like peptidoglycan-associated protein
MGHLFPYVDLVMSVYLRKRRLGCLVLSLTLLFGGPRVVLPDTSPLESQVYMAGLHESEWAFSGSAVRCELRHTIPQFGVAVFRRIAGEDLYFRLNSFQPIPEKLEGTLREVSPSWEHAAPDELQQHLEIHSGMEPIRLGRKPSGWLLTSLSKGQVGSFGFLDWDDSRRQVYVRLSPVQFQKPYREFKQCLSRLSPEGFESLKHSTVYFPLDIHKLDKQAKQSLDRLAQFITADDKLTAITISGHADDQGTRRYNKKLSAKRAASVNRYLTSKGVDASMIKQRHFGESRPAIPKRTEQARAANRRAEIRLTRRDG